MVGDRVQARVDGAVEDHGLDPVAEAFGVGGAQFRSVREAEIVDLVFPERRAHRVDIAGRRRGSDVRQEFRAHPVHAALRELAVDLLDARNAGGAVVGHRLRR